MHRLYAGFGGKSMHAPKTVTTDKRKPPDLCKAIGTILPAAPSWSGGSCEWLQSIENDAKKHPKILVIRGKAVVGPVGKDDATAILRGAAGDPAAVGALERKDAAEGAARAAWKRLGVFQPGLQLGEPRGIGYYPVFTNCMKAGPRQPDGLFRRVGRQPDRRSPRWLLPTRYTVLPGQKSR